MNTNSARVLPRANSTSMRFLIRYLLIGLCSLNLWTVARADSSYITTSLGLLTDSYGDPKGLTNRLTGVNWMSNTISGLFAMSGGTGVTATVSFKPLTNTGEILITMTMTNPTAAPVSVAPTFPLLTGLSPGANLTYCFPQEGDLIHTNGGSSARYYSAGFPLQFVDYYSPAAGGIYIMSEDQSNYAKTYTVYSSLTTATNEVSYNAQTIPAGGTWILSCVIGAHTGDWHAALTAYRRWVGTWYNPISPRKPWFQNVYNLRDQFVFTNYLSSPPALDPVSTQYVFSSYLLAQYQAAFGGVDLMHLFDWSTDPIYGRVLGDYNAWTNLISASAFAGQITNLNNAGIPVGLYFEGYLVATNSAVGEANGAAWQLEEANGSSYPSADFVLCPDVTPWQTNFANACSNAISVSSANAVYVDEFGFGYQYLCYNTNHNHAIPSPQLQAEASMLAQIRSSLTPNTPLYSEERGTDVGSQYLDGSFSSAVVQCIKNGWNNPSGVDLARFALPSFKVFENLFNDDAPFANPSQALQAFQATFFNGEGWYLEGPLNGTWYPGAIGPLITQTHSILRGYADAFASTNPTPLVTTLNANVYANQFPGTYHTVWTLYNASTNTVSGQLLAVTNLGSSVYYDAWNSAPLTPAISNNLAYLTLTLPPNGLGCVVQQIYYSSNTANGNLAAGYWRLDEPVTSASTATNLGSLGSAANGLYSTNGVVGGQAGVIVNDPDTACAFDGVAGKMDVPYNSALNSNAFSIECWINPSNAVPSNYMTVMNSRQAASYSGYTIYLSPDGTNEFWTGLGTNWDHAEGLPIVANHWTHLVGAYDGTNKFFYVNGVLVSSNRVKYVRNTTTTSPCRIGAGGDGTSVAYYFKGKLDEPAVYSYCLSAQQVLADYTAASITNLGAVSLVPPVVLISPTNETLLCGQQSTLEIQAAGSLPLNYQWLLNGTNLLGQTNAALTAIYGNSGSYSLVITNSAGVVTSSVASVTITAPLTGIYSNSIAANNPLGYWRLDEASTAGTTATNYGSLGAAGNGNYSATGVTGGQPGAIIGDSDTAVSFDGVAGLVQVPYSPALNSNAFSVEFWANPAVSVPTNYMAAVSSRTVTNYSGFTVYVGPTGTWQFWTGNGYSWSILSGPAAVADQWLYIVGTFDGSNKVFYINGVQVASNQPGYKTNSAGPLQIGAGTDASGGVQITNFYFAGAVDEVAVYGYALSAAQIVADYNAGTDNGHMVVPHVVLRSLAPTPPPSIQILKTGDGLQVQWSGGTLEQATQWTGPYTEVNGATSPLNISNSTTSGQVFYRVKQ